MAGMRAAPGDGEAAGRKYDGHVRFAGHSGSFRSVRTIVVVGMSLAGLRAGRDVAPRRVRRPHRRDRRRAAPAVRPAAALEGVAARRLRTRRDRACASRASTTSSSTGGSTRARSRSISARAKSSSHDGERIAFDGLMIATGATPRRLPGPAEPRRRVHAAHARRRARVPRAARRAAEGRGDRRRLHRRRDRGDVPGARPRRDGARSAAAADGARPRPRARRGDRRCAPRSRRRPAHRRAGRRDRGRRCRSGARRSARRRLASSTPTWSSSAWACVPETGWLEGSGLTIDNGVVCDATCLGGAGRRRRRRRRALAEPAVRRRVDAARALDERDRAGRARGPALARARRARSRRCRSCGPTSTTARSRPSASCRPTPTCTSRTARSPSASSSRCSARADGSSARSGFNRPRNVMQYRRMIAERASWDDALQLANQ